MELGRLTRVLVGFGGAFGGVDSTAQQGIRTGHTNVQSLIADLVQRISLCAVKQVVFIHLLTTRKTDGVMITTETQSQIAQQVFFFSLSLSIYQITSRISYFESYRFSVFYKTDFSVMLLIAFKQLQVM